MINKVASKEVLKLDNVCKTYDMGENIAVRAICSIDLSLVAGDFMCILGPSGSGKSTLLHIMGLLDRPTGGLVYIDGKNTTEMTPEEQARIRGQKIGFIFQTFNLVQSLRAWENAALPLLIQGIDANTRKEKAIAMLTKLGIGDRVDHYPAQLSGGQRQRVAIARALINDPAVILADEPTGNLDSKTGKEVLGILQQLHDEGRTMVVITHDEGITKIAHRTIRIKDGIIIDEKVNRN
jgi:putative ABC transport system ATP-binding protein